MKCWTIPCAVLAASVSLVSCVKSVDDMIDEYNRTTDPGTGNTVSDNVQDTGSELGPGDEGFHKWDMLKDVYSVTDNGSLQLAAPNHGCTYYTWSLYTYDDKVPVPFVPLVASTEPEPDPSPEWKGTGENHRRINIYVPESKLTVGIYSLTLVVIGEDGTPYDDTARICIYPALKH